MGASIRGNRNNHYIYSTMKISYIHTTNYLSKIQVESLFKAGEKAFEMNCPLNRFITIHNNDFADPKRPQKFIVELLNHVRKWLRRRNFPVAYLYTLEKGKIKGIHVHLLIHIPNGYQIEFKRAMAKWLPFEVKKPKVTFKSIQYPTYGKLSQLNGCYGILRYICKGVDPKDPTHGIEPKYQGNIMGRRWGTSQLLRTARK